MSEGFLILSRRPQEGVTITVPASETETVVSVSSLGVQGCQVKLGFKASSDVTVLRDELIKHNTAEKTEGAA
ncbi:Carbon storage regulator [Marinomonas spartinae]|uniref:Carbon storage regulator n=1 Tax=Marinomonas spartinae TaxID=1792290 RepID=A0A1A8TAB4_9GAMM|nr:carbon storage regulator [Marinomonas spartinae]SBS29004.1 Carbon storage regulator [Marinomonas spartinae]